MSADVPKFDPAWIRRGYFDLKSVENRRKTFSVAVTGELKRTTSIKRHAGYPSRDLRHSLYWREGNDNYKEAQFFASISKHHAVLSLGVSVEKGDERVDNRSWDWGHVVKVAPRLVNDKVPQLAADLRGPLLFWLHRSVTVEKKQVEQGGRTFVFEDGQWFERHEGRTAAKAILQAITEEDRNENWVNLHVGYELTETESSDLSPAEFAERLRAFDALRVFMKKPAKSKRT